MAEAIDPAVGLPSLHDFPPSMKQVREFLEPRHQKEIRDADMIARFSRKRLPAPPSDPESDKRIADGLKDLANHLRSGFGPSTSA